MKKVLASLCAASLVTAAAFAGDDAKDLKKVVEDQGIYVETAQKGVTLSGYVDTSYTYQFDGIRGGGNANNGTNSALRQFDVSSGFNVNAVKLALEKALPDKNEYAAGFRIDAMAGSDAVKLAATDPSLGGTSLYVEQAYVQFRAPVGNGLDFKFGKFVTLLGYEVIESPANLNYSRGLLFTNAIPLTHTGALASYKFNDTVNVAGGIVNDWNGSSNGGAAGAGFSTFSPAFLGQVNVNAPGGNANITQSVIYSVTGEPGSASPLFTANGPVATYDIWGNWSPKFNDKLLLGFNFDIGDADHAAAGVSDTWWGGALYAKYQFTKVFSLAARSEYLHDDNGLKLAVAAKNVDVWSETITAGFNIWENLLTRVEYRADFGDPTAFGGGVQHEIALNLVYSF